MRKQNQPKIAQVGADIKLPENIGEHLRHLRRKNAECIHE